MVGHRVGVFPLNYVRVVQDGFARQTSPVKSPARPPQLPLIPYESLRDMTCIGAGELPYFFLSFS